MDSKNYGYMCGEYVDNSNIMHHNIPSHNMNCLDYVKNVSRSLNLDDDLDVDFQNIVNRKLVSFPFYKPFPFNIYLNTILFPGSGLTDEARDLIKDKLKWKQKLTSLAPKDYKGAIRNLNKVKKRKLTHINLDLANYLKHFEKDPDSNFDSDYNWLYTGGNIASAKLKNKCFLINADDTRRSKVLNILQFNCDFNKLRRQTYYHMESYSPVFQVVCHSRNEKLLIAARQKEIVHLLRFDGKNTVRKIWSVESEDMRPLISCDLSENEDKIAIADNKYIRTFDLETMRKVFQCVTNKNKSPAWHQVVFDNFSKEIYLADHQCLRIFDIRVKSSKPRLVFKPIYAINECESLCNIIKSGLNSNIIYVAASHCLLQVDVRIGKASQKWTHLMQAAPLFGKTCLRNGEELVLLQSDNADEAVAVVNETTKGAAAQFSSNSVPYALGNTKEPLRMAHYNGFCLQPIISERFDFAVTGLATFVDKKHVISLFTTNSGGDIMMRKLKRKVDPKVIEKFPNQTEEIMNSMKNYEKHCKHINLRETITATEIVDMSPILKVYGERNPRVRWFDLLTKYSKKKKSQNCDNYWKYSEMFAPESLSFCKDYLAERFLQVWGHKTNELSNFKDKVKNEIKDDIDSKAMTKIKIEKCIKEYGT